MFAISTILSNLAGNRPVTPTSAILVSLAALLVLACAPSPAVAQNTKSGTGALVQRIEQLEEQLVDMQVVIGTLQSLPQAAAPVGAPVQQYNPTTGANDQARIDGMETQIRALTAQIEQMAVQLRRLDAGGRQGALGNGYKQPQPGYSGAAPAAVAPPQATATIPGGFGQTTVQPSQGGAPQQPPDYGTRAAIDTRIGAITDPRKSYETAYGYLLQQQYGAAETAFSDFLRTYSNDPLAGNAQYWLGETYYVRGQYKSAANAFLKGYETYAKSKKAPDSLLKLAMSLEKLGHKDAACSSLSELVVKFPKAPPHVKKRAASERGRVGC